ncbi:hypothetical protein, partial [Leptospira noguchii]|uniref:hypothetical protein n=1 Tax=Leptospira noguchii TaxID=28182 RepID=UPI0038D3D4B3
GSLEVTQRLTPYGSLEVTQRLTPYGSLEVTQRLTPYGSLEVTQRLTSTVVRGNSASRFYGRSRKLSVSLLRSLDRSHYWYFIKIESDSGISQ